MIIKGLSYLVKLFNFNLFSQGFERVFNSFADIQLDIPNAHTLLETFTDMCARDGIIPISLTIKVPSRYVMSVLWVFSSYDSVVALQKAC